MREPTCPHPVLERVPAVHQDLLQGLGVVRELQVEALHALQELVRVVEVQHFGGPVKRLPHVVEEDVHDLQQELHGLLLAVLGGQQICEANQPSAPALGATGGDEAAPAARSSPGTWTQPGQGGTGHGEAGRCPGAPRPVGKGEPGHLRERRGAQPREPKAPQLPFTWPASSPEKK